MPYLRAHVTEADMWDSRVAVTITEGFWLVLETMKRKFREEDWRMDW